MYNKRKFEQLFGFAFQQLSNDIQICTHANGESDGLTTGILLFNPFGYYYFHIGIDRLDSLTAPEKAISPDILAYISKFLDRKDILYKTSRKVIAHLGRFFCSGFGYEAIKDIFIRHDEIIDSDFSLYGLTHTNIKELKENWLNGWINKNLSTFKNINDNTSDEVISQVLHLANFLSTIIPLEVPTRRNKTIDNDEFSIYSNIESLHYAVKKTKYDTIINEQFERQGEWLFDFKNPVTQIIEYCLMCPESVKNKERELDYFIQTGYSEGTISQFFKELEPTKLYISHYPLTYLNQYQGLVYLVQPVTENCKKGISPQAIKVLKGIIREYNFTSSHFEQKFLLAKEIFSKISSNNSFKKITEISPLFSSAFMTVTYHKEKEKGSFSGYYHYKTPIKDSKGIRDISSDLVKDIQNEIIRRFLDTDAKTSPPYVQYIDSQSDKENGSQVNGNYSLCQNLRQSLISDSVTTTTYIIILKFPKIGEIPAGIMLLYYDDKIPLFTKFAKNDALEIFEKERKKNRIANNYRVLHLKIQELISKDIKAFEMLNGKKMLFEQTINTIKNDAGKNSKKNLLYLTEITKNVIKNYLKSPEVYYSRARNSPEIKFSPKAILKLNESDFENIEDLIDFIQKRVEIALNLDNEEDTIIISPEMLLGLPQPELEKINYNHKEIKAIEILDKFEAAANIIKSNKKINNRTIGDYYGTTPQSVSESIKQYREEIVELLNFYSFKWQLIRKHLSPVRKLCKSNSYLSS